MHACDAARRTLRTASFVTLIAILTGPAWAGASGDDPLSFRLDGVYADARSWARALTAAQALSMQESQEETLSESTTITTYDDGDSWGLKGPYFLRSADPEEPGEIDLKFVFGYDTASDGSDDDAEIELVLEWGLMENIEFILESEIELGDGGVAGNADITAFGFHTRFWKEDGWLPAVAMRNLIRVPNGYHSSGVDYTARLLVTKSIIPGKFRFHLNPFLKSVNGHNEEDARRFQWGTAVGVDYRCTEDFVIIFDYLHRSSDEDHQRNNHALEFGFDWKLAEHHYVAFGTEVGLDGDGHGTNFGAKISYIFSIGGPHLGGGG